MNRLTSNPQLRRIIAVIAVLAALALLINLAALWSAPAPAIDETQADTRIIFRAAQPIVLGRCGDVSWQVSEGASVWINGQGVASEGTTAACIDQYFTRPQINVYLPDGTWRLYELSMTSLIFTGATALTFTAQFTAVILLVITAAWLSGVRFPKFPPIPSRFAPLNAQIALYVLIWVAYVSANVYLRVNTPISDAPAEAYITPLTIAETWQRAERPITIPLIYKLLNNDFEAIATLQWALSLLSWSALAGIVLLHLSSPLLRVLAFALILSLSLARDLYFWNSVLISESISQSLFNFLVAIGMFALWVYQRRIPKPLTQVVAAIAVLILSIIWSFTRDSNSYVLLATAGLLLLLLIGSAIKHIPATKLIFPAVLMIGFVGLFLYQNQDANRGLRWRYPLMNVIARRVLPYPAEVAFFAERGMPTTPDVMRFAGQFAWAFDLTPLEPWLTHDSRSVYLQYLLSDPVETVLTPIKQWEMMLLFDYRVIQEHRRDIVLPSWIETFTAIAYLEQIGLLIFSAVGLLLLALWAWRTPDARLSIVIVLLLLLYPLAFMVWYGDGFAVERHAVPTAIQWRLSIWLAIIFALDALVFAKSRTKSQN